MGKRGLSGAEVGRSGTGAAAAEVLEQQKRRALAQRSRAAPLPPTSVDALSLERRRLLPLHPLYKPECFLFQIFNAGILNSL